MQTASKRVLNGWAMYDWANSVYNLVITSTIFPAYYAAVTGDGKEATVDHVTIFGKTFIKYLTKKLTYFFFISFRIP